MASVVTQVVVDKNDPAFVNLSKPIGPFYSEEEAKAEAEKSGATFKEDAGRGWRKVVASPKPVDIKEINTIRTLLNDGQVVVAAGGGGIPVVKEANGSLTGVEAVIDKDFASQRLAELVEADLFHRFDRCRLCLCELQQTRPRKIGTCQCRSIGRVHQTRSICTRKHAS